MLTQKSVLIDFSATEIPHRSADVSLVPFKSELLRGSHRHLRHQSLRLLENQERLSKYLNHSDLSDFIDWSTRIDDRKNNNCSKSIDISV